MAFPGASARRDEASYVVVGAPLDVSTTFNPGTRFGPERVRHFAEALEDYDRRTDAHFSHLGVHDAGDLHAWNDAPAYLEHLEGTLSDVQRDGAVPLVVGGEHTVTVAGVRALQPDAYVCLDAHLDLRPEFDGDEWSHATVTHHVLDVVDEVVLVGCRSGSEEEWERTEVEDVTVVSPEEVADWPSDPTGSVYLSVDIDAADPGFAPGTGTPSPVGLTPQEMRSVIRAVAPDTVGFDVVEVNDRDDGQAAALGATLLREFVFNHAAQHHH